MPEDRRPKIWLWLLLMLSVGAALGRWVAPTKVRVLPPLPAEVVEVEVVKEIPVPVEVPGPARVVDRVEWRTREVEVPTEIINTVIEYRDRPVEGRVRVEAHKFEGVDAAGEARFGWTGQLFCEIRPDGMDWIPMVSEPLDLTTSLAVTTVPPAPVRRGWREIALGIGTAPSVYARYAQSRNGRWGWWMQARLHLDPEVVGLGSFGEQGVELFSEDTLEFSGGASFRW